MQVIIKHSRSIPIAFVRHEGDAQDATDLLGASKHVEEVKGVVSDRLLRILGRHWDTVSSVCPNRTDDVVLSGGQRAWIKGNALPLLRSLVDTANGFPCSKEAHDRLAPYYSIVGSGILHGVSPFHPDQERLRSWTEYKDAVAEHKGKEPAYKAIIRGFETIIKPQSSGGYSTPSADACAQALPHLKTEVLDGMAQIVARLLGRNGLLAALEAVDCEDLQHHEYLERLVVEQPKQAE